MNEDSIFAEAIEITSPEARAAFLERACAGDGRLRAEVEELLKSHNDAGSFLGSPVVHMDPTEVLSGTCVDEESGTDKPDTDIHLPEGAAPEEEHESEEIPLDFLSPCPVPGRLGLLGPYEILEVIGRGGMGLVFRAFDPKLSRVVALKMLSPALASNPTAVKRFLREARAAAAVSHDHVVTIHAVEEANRLPYLVMECVVGQSLQQKIDREGALDVREILRIGMQIAAGLAAAHKQGLVHRDIKPSNILLENGVERVKITDFGLARAVDDVSMTQSGQIAGTPQYMSPEQAHGDPVDHRTDLFSLGSVLYTMCTGRPAFRADSTVAVIRRVCDDTPRPIRDINLEVPEWLEQIVNRLMEKKPERRIQTARDVADLLSRCLAHLQQPLTAPQPPSLSELVPVIDALRADDRRRTAPRSRAGLTIGLVVLFSAITLGILEAIGVTALTASLFKRPPRETAKPAVASSAPSTEKDVPPPAKDSPEKADPEWVALFNGRDLSGWTIATTSAPLSPDALEAGEIASMWMVQDGILRPRGPAGYLVTQRGDYENFHFRVEVRINSRGDSGQFFRAHFSDPAIAEIVLPGGKTAPRSFSDFRGGYEAQINCSDHDRTKTGSLWGFEGTAVNEVLVPANTWCTQEVIADGKHIVIKVDGRVTVDFFDEENRYARGHLALQYLGEGTHVEFRKIEVRELPASPPQQPWMQYFNGVNLDGWKPHPDYPADWRVEEGVLIGRGPRGFLISERSDFRDFHLRCEARINAEGDSGLFFRATDDVGYRGGFSPPSRFYEAEISNHGPQTRTGGLWAIGTDGPVVAVDEILVPSDTWFTMEVIARGPSITVKVNGRVTADVRNYACSKGHLAWQIFDPSTSIEIRKIEVQDLGP